MAQAAVIIETPALAEVGLPIAVTEYDIQREINAAGSWAVSFPATQTLANQVKSRWRVSIIEEGRAGYLMRRGVVLTRNYRVNADGTGILTLAGYTRLYTLTTTSTHFNLVYSGTQSVSQIADNLAGEAVTVPFGASAIFPKVTFSESSKLAALLKIGEIARYNLRETFDEDGFEFTSWDDVPDSGYRFVTVEQAGPELENAAANGMGLIAGTPTVGYDGKDLATRIIPIGVDFDGMPLELNESNLTTPYTIQAGTNPDATSFYYLEDATATTAVGLIELQYHRQDVKNPSDNAGTRLAAANALYKLAVAELQKRKSDVISFATEIANARHIDALPGERVRIQFRGRARTFAGSLVWQDIDQDFLIVKRRDSSGVAGVRGVSFTLAAPEVPLADPELPDAVPIPPPPRDPPDPPEPTNRDPYDGDDGSLGPDAPPFEDPGLPETPGIDPGAIAELPPFSPDGPNPYQDCCAPPTEWNGLNEEEEGGGGGGFGGGAQLPAIDAGTSPFSVDALLGGAVAGDKFVIITWSHAHDGTPNTVTPSAPWLDNITSLDSIDAADGEARDTTGSSYDVTAGTTRVEVWLADIVPGSIGTSPQLTFANPAGSTWPSGSELAYGGYGVLLHSPDPTTPIPQIDFASAVDGSVTHTMAAPDPSSFYLIVAYRRGIVGGSGGGSDSLVAPSGWTRSSLVHQDIELNNLGELIHAGVAHLVVKHSADGETAIEWDGTGAHMISVVIEVKP